MKKLPAKTRVQILKLMTVGMSMRAISRTLDVSFNTIAKLLVDAGEACMELHDELVRNVSVTYVQCDKIWSFNYCKAKAIPTAKSAPEDAGSAWTWTALDGKNKMILSYFVSDRSGQSAITLMDDLRSRVVNRIQLSTDGHKAYLDAVEGASGGDVDYAQLTKVYGPSANTTETKYSPAGCIGTKTRRVEGNPDMAKVPTSHVERSNLSLRMRMRRFTRLTNGHSKKLANHAYMVAIYTFFYNFIRDHKTLSGATPAMTAGLARSHMTFDDVVAKIEAMNPPKKRGPYKKQESKA